MHIGRDLRDRAKAEISTSDAPVYQIDLPMAESSTPAACETLRELGFFFSAVLPEYLDGDVLRLQRIAAATITRPELVTDDARRILLAIEADHARARVA